MPASPAPEASGIQSVEVGFALLAALALKPGACMLRDLAADCGMSAAKAHRYLASFQRLGLVVQDKSSARYDLGPTALHLGLAALARIDGVALARERLAALQTDLGLTVAIAVWGNRGPTIVHWAEAPGVVSVNLKLGDVMPLLQSATGRCFAAFMRRELIENELAEALAQARTAARPKRATDFDPQADMPRTQRELEHLITHTQQTGCAVVRGTLLPSIWGAAAPVFDADGHVALVVVSMGGMAAVERLGEAAVQRAVVGLARQLSADMGADRQAQPGAA
jgi:DNA-binding IclR family transcriptional regulator